ncbi:hypothetical protein CYMTET_21778 [Cymbomonas tetramitiformis]|uniref:Uncharacterized protein n=1 Tax=Cymbomonas tetramitiformis TaxID=36881 RepID=A0AAE0G180_9CHLO|nr:hypothetical protein CYMTET_21778 [Cymbomonas tetramitiformis]
MIQLQETTDALVEELDIGDFFTVPGAGYKNHPVFVGKATSKVYTLEADVMDDTGKKVLFYQGSHVIDCYYCEYSEAYKSLAPDVTSPTRS